MWYFRLMMRFQNGLWKGYSPTKQKEAHKATILFLILIFSIEEVDLVGIKWRKFEST